MAVAGKVAITLSTENGGAWNADITYDRLVAVKHNNNLYISRKTVANVEPPNDEFWFLALEGFGGDDVQALIDRMNELSDLIQAIINGTTQVGNAKTLDGHDADYFFPKLGGTIDGNVTVSSSEATLRTLTIANALRRLGFRVGADGGAGLYDYTNEKAVFTMFLDGTNTFNGTASGNLPLTGGTITANNDTPITVKSTTSQSVYQRFINSAGTETYFGFDGSGNAKIVGKGTLLHTGNKPTGTYTGNGDATKRTIATGGIGKALLVYGGGYGAIVYPDGAIIMNGTTVTSLPVTQCSFNDGNLVLATANEALNTSGGKRGYAVL